MTYLDTHVLVALYSGEWQKLGKRGREAIDNDDLLVSPAAVLELELLHEIGRLKTPANRLVNGLGEQIGLRVCELPFSSVVQYALAEKWGRDPFDRLIVANARANDASLITKDQRIHRHFSRAVW